MYAYNVREIDNKIFYEVGIFMKNFKVVLTALGLSALLVGCQSGSNNAAENTANTANNANMNNNAAVEETEENAANDENNAMTEEEPMDEEATSEDVTIIDSELSTNDIEAIFLDNYPEGEITKISFDNDENPLQFNVEGIFNDEKVQMNINANTEEVIESDDKLELEIEDDDIVLDLTEIKDWKDAAKAALDSVDEEVTIESFELSEEDGQVLYEFEFVENDVEIALDAKDLSIVTRADD